MQTLPVTFIMLVTQLSFHLTHQISNTFTTTVSLDSPSNEVTILRSPYLLAGLLFRKRASGFAIHCRKLHAASLIINCPSFEILTVCFFVFYLSFFFGRIILLSKASHVLFRPTLLAKHRQIRQDRFFAKREPQTLGNCCWFHRTTRHSCNFDHQSQQHLGCCHRL